MTPETIALLSTVVGSVLSLAGWGIKWVLRRTEKMQEESWKLADRFESIDKSIRQVGDALTDHITSNGEAHKRQAEILEKVAERLGN